VDLVAESVPDLLAKIDGRTVETERGTVTLRTARALRIADRGGEAAEAGGGEEHPMVDQLPVEPVQALLLRLLRHGAPVVHEGAGRGV